MNVRDVRLAKLKWAAAAAVVIIGVLLFQRCTTAPDVAVEGPSESPGVAFPGDTGTGSVTGGDADAPVESVSAELWEQALAGTLGSIDEVVALMNSPENSDLDADSFITATQTARDVLGAAATGAGRERWPSYFVPSAPELPDTQPGILCSDVQVRAANARQLGGSNDQVQVMVLWDGACPVGPAAGVGMPRSTVIDLDRTGDGWAPVRRQVGPSPGLALPGMRFPLSGTCSFTDDFARERTTSPYTVDGERINGGITIQADRGSPVVSIERGVVASVGWTPIDGNYVVIAAGSGTHWLYAGLASIAPSLYQSQPLEAGAALGTVGATPAEPDRPHLLVVQTPGPASTRPENPFETLASLAAADGIDCQIAF